MLFSVVLNIFTLIPFVDLTFFKATRKQTQQRWLLLAHYC